MDCRWRTCNTTFSVLSPFLMRWWNIKTSWNLPPWNLVLYALETAFNCTQAFNISLMLRIDLHCTLWQWNNELYWDITYIRNSLKPLLSKKTWHALCCSWDILLNKPLSRHHHCVIYRTLKIVHNDVVTSYRVEVEQLKHSGNMLDDNFASKDNQGLVCKYEFPLHRSKWLLYLPLL